VTVSKMRDRCPASSPSATPQSMSMASASTSLRKASRGANRPAASRSSNNCR
jgi:hypothetical protein